MATIEKRGQSYRITVSDGYESKSQNRPRMTWKPDPKWNQAKVDKELEKVADAFEAEVKKGHYLAGEKILFKDFVETWFKDYANQNLKAKTIESYRFMLESRIIPAIGHHPLAKIKPPILIKFQNALQESGLNENVRYTAREGIRDTWKASKVKLADTGLSKDTLTSVLNQRHVSLATAQKIAKALKMDLDSLFAPTEILRDLSARTVGYYMRCISTLLSSAVAWQLIESNPCERVKPPKVVKKQIKYLEVDQTLKLIKAALVIEDERVKAAVLTFLYTGVRKGELCGLRWSDFDFDNGTVTVRRIIQQIDGKGIVESTPKTDSGERSMSISADLIKVLRIYKVWQNEERLKVGDKWQGREFKQAKAEGKEFSPVDWVFTAWNGYPLHPSTLYHWIKQFLVEQGHPDMTVHGLRHSNISLLLAQGIDLITVSKRAGHAKPSITADIYAHALKKPDEAAADTLNELFRPSMKDSV